MALEAIKPKNSKKESSGCSAKYPVTLETAAMRRFGNRATITCSSQTRQPSTARGNVLSHLKTALNVPNGSFGSTAILSPGHFKGLMRLPLRYNLSLSGFGSLAGGYANLQLSD